MPMMFIQYNVRTLDGCRNFEYLVSIIVTWFFLIRHRTNRFESESVCYLTKLVNTWSNYWSSDRIDDICSLQHKNTGMLDRNYLKSIIVINSSSFDFESKFVLFDTRLTISLLFNY